MTIGSRIILSALALGIAVSSPAAAQDKAVAAGAAVKDTGGASVGTVVRVDGDHYVVKTDRHEARLPASSFTVTADGLLFGMTQAQLNAAIEQTKAAAAAKVAPGAPVFGAAGAAVGTIEAVDDQYVTLKLVSGASIRAPRNAFAPIAKGVGTSLTAAQLEAAATGAAGENSGGE